MNCPLFRLENLVYFYNTQEVINIPNFAFASGKIYAFVGPNGAGKTTLLKLLNLLLYPTCGKIFFKDTDIYSSNVDLTAVRRTMTMMLQKPVMLSGTVERNVAYGLKVRRISKKERHRRVEEALNDVDMKNFIHRKATELSGGEQQRVALARALAISPEILFLDEPAAHVDIKSQSKLERILRQINQEKGVTIFFSTHSLQQANRLGDEIISIFEGSIIQSTPENLFTGQIIDKQDQLFFVDHDLMIIVDDNNKKARHLIIEPDKINLSTNKPQSNHVNIFQGHITSITMKSSNKVELQINAQKPFLARIGLVDFKHLKKEIGDKIFISFKADATHLF